MNPTAAPTRTPTKPAGWIYLLHTGDDNQKYVGQSERPVWKRVNEERKTFPWGPDILPGRDGYTILRRVDSTGDRTEDAIRLDLAEAEEIARWHPSDNAFRPDPQVFRDRLDALHNGIPVGFSTTPTGIPLPPFRSRPVGPNGRPTGRPNARTVGSRGGRPTTPRGVPWRTVGFVLLSAACTVVGFMWASNMTNPNAPWVVIPMAAVLGPAVVVGVFRSCTKPTRRRSRTRGRRR